MTLSTKLNHLPPLTPLPSADTMRSVQIDASAHHHLLARASVPCVALAGTPETASCVMPNFAPPPSCLPSLAAVLLAAPLAAQKRLRYYEGSDSRRPHLRATGLSAYSALSSRRSAPNHASRSVAALSVVSAPSTVPGFATIQQARHGFTPNRIRSPTDWRFASGCSPPRLAATQLPSATKLRRTSTGTCTLLTKRPCGRTGWPGQARP